MGYEAYTNARDSALRNNERQRAEQEAARQRDVMMQAGNALGGGDADAAAKALFGGGMVRDGLAVQGAASEQARATRDRQRAALAAAATGLMYVPEAERSGVFQSRVAPFLTAEGVPAELVNQITPEHLSDGGLRGFITQMGGELPAAPSGYRWTPDGAGLQFIPGGPEDPANQRPLVTPQGTFWPRGAMPSAAPSARSLGATIPEGWSAAPPRPNQAPSAPAAGGAERNQTPRVTFRNSGEARSTVQQIAPGVRVTSADRTRADQARLRRQGYKPSDTSFHLQGRALDLVPPPGMGMAALEAKMRQAGFRVLNEGTHIHVSW